MDHSLKDRVLDAVDIVDVIGERVALTRKGREYVGLCPFHADHNPSMSVSPAKQIFKCWSCGAGGDVIHFIQKISNIPFREALHTLAQRAGLDIQTAPTNQRNAALREKLQAACSWAAQHFRRNLTNTPGGTRAIEYAHKRGLTNDTLERYQLGYAPNAHTDLLNAARHAGLEPRTLEQAGLIGLSDRGEPYDRFRQRLIFPIRDALGRPIAFGGRTLADHPAKYLNSPETPLFSKSRVLYGFDVARQSIQDAGAVIIVEGYLDAVMLAQFGITNVVATLGTALTDAHVKLLRPVAREVYLCFDSDQAGVRAAERAVEVALRTRLQVKVVLLTGGKDPADCVLADGPDAFRQQLPDAMDALQFKWSQALKLFDQDDARGRRAATEEFLQFIAGAAVAGGVDLLDQHLLINRLSELLGAPAEEIVDLLGRAKRNIRRRSGKSAAERTDGASNYQLNTRGLPAGLIASVETVLGLLLSDSDCWRFVDDAVPRAAELSKTWNELYGVLLDVHEDMGKYSIGEVMERCQDAAICELVSRARNAVAGVNANEDTFRAACERLASELNVLRMSELRQNLHAARSADAGGEDLFTSLRNLAREQSGALPVERRWSAPTS